MPICASFSSAVGSAAALLEADDALSEADEALEEALSVDDDAEAEAAPEAEAAALPDASLATSEAVSQAANSAAAANSVRRRWIILVSKFVFRIQRPACFT